MVQKGVVLGGNAGAGQGIEKSGLAHIGQADDAAFQTHGKTFKRFGDKRSILATPTRQATTQARAHLAPSYNLGHGAHL